MISGGNTGQGPRQHTASHCNADQANAAEEINSPNYVLQTADIAAATDNKLHQVKIIDIGATSHYSPHQSNFTSFRTIEPYSYKLHMEPHHMLLVSEILRYNC